MAALPMVSREQLQTAMVEFDEQFYAGEVDGEAADEFGAIVFKSEFQAERAAGIGDGGGEKRRERGGRSPTPGQEASRVTWRG